MEMGAKASWKKFALLSFLMVPLLCFVNLRSSVSSRNLPKLIIEMDRRSVDNGDNYMKFLISRLVRGTARTELRKNGVSCVVEPRSTFCVISGEVRITAGPPRSPTIYLSDSQVLSAGDSFPVLPYPRTTDTDAMLRTAPVNLVTGEPAPPPCDVTHSVPAVVFSTGGFAGNFFHDVSEVLIPLFLTAGLFRSRVQLIVTDYEAYWPPKYQKFLSQLSDHELVVASSPYGDVAGGVYCFPAAVVGLKFHGEMECNASMSPGGASTMDFKRFLHESFSLKVARLTETPPRQKPLLVLLLRWKSRMLLNAKEVVHLAEKVGFRVKVFWPETTTNVEESAELVNSCSVLMGIHDAGLTNMVFLPAGAVLLQIVPLGLDWHADTYFGRAAERFGLKYVEYKAAVKESSLSAKYPRDHPVLRDPTKINRQGYNVSKALYVDGQNLTINIARFKGSLVEAMKLLP